MDKCWFVLQQTYFQPADIRAMRSGYTDKPLSLGHIISDLKHLDNVINREGYEPFPVAMQIQKVNLKNFDWERNSGSEVTVGLQGGGNSSSSSSGSSSGGAALLSVASPSPGTATATAPVPGAEVEGGITTAFQKRVKRHWQFDRLDMYIVQPTESYVDRAMEIEAVEAHVRDSAASAVGFRQVYMVTGIVVARGGAKTSESRSGESGLTVGASVAVPAMLHARPEANFRTGSDEGVSFEVAEDFIWAVRLAKITKHGWQRRWSHETVTDRAGWWGPGAVFSMNSNKPKLEKPEEVLASHGLEEFEVVRDPEFTIVFVLS